MLSSPVNAPVREPADGIADECANTNPVPIDVLDWQCRNGPWFPAWNHGPFSASYRATARRSEWQMLRDQGEHGRTLGRRPGSQQIDTSQHFMHPRIASGDSDQSGKQWDQCLAACGSRLRGPYHVRPADAVECGGYGRMGRCGGNARALRSVDRREGEAHAVSQEFHQRRRVNRAPARRADPGELQSGDRPVHGTRTRRQGDRQRLVALLRSQHEAERDRDIKRAK